ncbi:MAG: preprotein translocase subunit YajC [Geodermatophilaceae bacterium]|nr:preprotein translocase subunit YajC [Geodermatophilaceae bacterium]
MEQLLPILLIVLAFVLLFVLPARQRKKIAERQSTMQQTLRIGTPIVLTCGLYGTVAALQETTLDVQAGPDAVLRFARAAILEVQAEADGGAAGSTQTGRVDLGKSDDH